jgi:predicted CXXCH cytochrome family protein
MRDQAAGLRSDCGIAKWMPALRRFLGLMLLIFPGYLLAGHWYAYSAPTEDRQHLVHPGPQTFVGSGQCKSCHSNEYQSWLTSQHAVAMQEANETTVLGKFDGQVVTTHGIGTTFFRRDGKYWVKAEGSDGKPADFIVRYTFGISPLQQYLIELPGGRLQALGLAWDTRPASAGGQRWFDLNPDIDLPAGHPLHWTGIDQNWNQQCAFCHSTNLQKHFDASANRFDTTWSEISVGCESCHGPGSEHVARASSGTPPDPSDNKSLAINFDERKGISWSRNSDGKPVRSAPRASSTEIERCALCHSRREQFSDDPSKTFFDAFRPALLRADLYHVDGQQQAEDYIYGSFLQSRMHAEGVTCSDCHDPHTQKLRAPGNAVCAQCHDAKRYDTSEHHHHRADGQGSRCASCHMPTTTYMVVDPRHDHSIRIPRPDLTSVLGTPNACNSCHQDKSATWASDAIKTWFGSPTEGFQNFAHAFDLADREAPGAQSELVKIIGDPIHQPAIVRASAIERLARFLTPNLISQSAVALPDPSPLVRMAAVGAIGGTTDAQMRARLLGPALSDKTAIVRIDAARALTGDAERYLVDDQKSAFESALAEYIAAQKFNSERPEAHHNLGLLYQQRGQFGEAQLAFEKAIAIDPTFVPAALALAELIRSQGDEAKAQSVITEALTKNPNSAPLLHVLGLSLVREKRTTEAIEQFRLALEAAPSDPRFAYVYAVALNDTGQQKQALEVLNAALTRNPYDRNLLMTAASFEYQTRDFGSALKHAELLMKLEPEQPEYVRMRDALREVSR